MLIPRALRESANNGESQVLMMKILRGIVSWIFLLGIVGLPYWICLIPLHDLLLSHDLCRQIAQSPGLWATFGSLAASNIWKAALMALLLTYFELWPERVLGAVFGDPSRLYEFDPPDRSQVRPQR